MTISSVLSIILCELFQAWHYYQRTVPGYLPYEFKHHFRMTKRTCQILSGNKSFLRAVNSQNIHLACEAAPVLLRVTPINSLWTIYKSCIISVFFHVVHVKYRTTGTGIESGLEWSNGTVHFDRSGPTEKSDPPRKVGRFFRTFPVGPNRSIQF